MNLKDQLNKAAAPLVSIIIPVYNAERHIAETIQSALNQSWQNIEVIIVDDGSTDSSVGIAKTFTDTRIKIYQQANKGASAARNFGLKQAGGKYIQFLDADDLLSSDKIAAQVALMNNSDEFIAVCNTVHFMDGTDPYRSPPTREWYNANWDDPVDFLLKLYTGPEVMPGYGGMIQPNAWLTPAALIKKAGYWNEFKCPDDDGEFFCRVILASQGVKYSPAGINYYRKYIKGTSLSAQKTAEAFENTFLAIELKYSYLKARFDNKLLDRIFARHYWELGVASYPAHMAISNKAIKRAKKFGYTGPKYVSGKFSMLLSKVLGWRFAKLISYIRHGG
ncbi:glycosyltransferase family A protein [Mucilaginibacter sp. AK015]|uniref:glycosyltransferase family 2 protein n=1 Tax=Mucilaginibacter sp. AK015 TaxID=2723072 RepID=UPI001608F908|nr:glycosyltransferase involved in cell wall biosynthesis [Mucilaginibacter sp. AK015]